MPLYLRKETPDGLLGIWKIEEEEVQLKRIVPPFFLHDEKYSSYKNQERRKEFLSIRALIKELIGEDFSIEYRENGAPELISSSPYKEISISHTKSYASVYLHKLKRVGVDIEQVAERVRKVRTYFLSKEEDLSLPEEIELSKLTLYWSAKEALFKISSQNTLNFKEEIKISPFPLREEGDFTANIKGESYSFSMKYLIEKDFVLVWTEKND